MNDNYPEDNGSSPHVLVLDQLECMLPLLVGVLAEELGEAGEGDVVTAEVRGLQGEPRC